MLNCGKSKVSIKTKTGLVPNLLQAQKQSTIEKQTYLLANCKDVTSIKQHLILFFFSVSSYTNFLTGYRGVFFYLVVCKSSHSLLFQLFIILPRATSSYFNAHVYFSRKKVIHVVHCRSCLYICHLLHACIHVMLSTELMTHIFASLLEDNVYFRFQ